MGNALEPAIALSLPQHYQPGDILKIPAPSPVTHLGTHG